MEKVFSIARATLNEVLTNRGDYFEVSMKATKQLGASEDDRRKALPLISSFFRNYYFIREVYNFLFWNENNQDLMVLVGIYYVNNGFVKVIKEKEALESFKEGAKELGITFNEKEDHVLLALNHIVFEKRKFDFPKIKRGSPRYLSVKYNLPEWFIKMMIKHYDKVAGLNICRELARSPKQYFVNNGFKPANADPKGEVEGFKNVKENVYLYTGKGPFKKNFYVQNKNLINVQLGYVDLLEKLPKLDHQNYTIYLGVKSFIYMPLIAKYYKNNNNVTIITKEMKENYELLSLKKTYNLKNVYYNEAKSDALESLISKKQDLFVLLSSSSEFEKFRSSPDYPVVFDQSKIDECIANEVADLENCSKYVESKGTLVYTVRTVGLKETRDVVASFVEKNPDFELVEEKQYLPHEEENSLFYYAILRRK